jgi:hypothetical protein
MNEFRAVRSQLPGGAVLPTACGLAVGRVNAVRDAPWKYHRKAVCRGIPYPEAGHRSAAGLGLWAQPRSNFISSAGDGSAGADVPPHRRCFVGDPNG